MGLIEETFIKNECSFTFFCNAFCVVKLGKVRAGSMHLHKCFRVFVLNVFFADVSNEGRNKLNFFMGCLDFGFHVFAEFAPLPSHWPELSALDTKTRGLPDRGCADQKQKG